MLGSCWTWEALPDRATPDWQEATGELKDLRDRLNSVVRALHRRHRNGLTVQHAMGRVIRSRSFIPSFVLRFNTPDEHDETDMRRLRNACRELKTAITSLGDPSRHSLCGIRRTKWSPSWQKDLVETSQKFGHVVRDLAASTIETAAIFDESAIGDPRWILNLLVFSAQAFKPEAAAGVGLLTSDIKRIRTAFAEWKVLKEKHSDALGRLAGSYGEGVFNLDLFALLGEWREASNAIVVIRSVRKKRVWAVLAAHTNISMPADVGTEISQLIDIKRFREEATVYEPVLSGFASLWRGFGSDIGRIEATLAWLVAHVISTEGPIFDDLLVQRIARAHGFGRAAGKIREIVLDVVERRFPRSSEQGRKIFWPEGWDKTRPPAFRRGSLEDRDHADIPLIELSSLAQCFLAEGAEPDEAAALMGRELGLGRLREAARARFEDAAQLAQKKALNSGLHWDDGPGVA